MPAQTFRIMAAFHGAIWPLLFVAFLCLLLMVWGRVQRGRKLVRFFVWQCQFLLFVTGLAMTYTYGFPFEFIFKGILALFLVYTMEASIGKLKKQDYRSFFIMIGGAISIALIVVYIGIRNLL
ncbi:DUF1516 family protein [Shouchella shacheensis]|uniref:DUF1516 family protein n=1 Tax=Shouchella shacheensis TaxID=1649580 RepID=UPI000740475F|nr:DUF1516 family protein [Shouchella shacheensis]